MYTGATSCQPSEHDNTYDLVLRMMLNYFDKGHILYVDNYYSGKPLFRDLLKVRELHFMHMCNIHCLYNELRFMYHWRTKRIISTTGYCMCPQ